MFQFEHKEYLVLLAVIPLLALLYILIIWMKRRNLKTFGEPALVEHLMPDASRFRYNLKFILMLTALSMVIIALAGPRFGTRLAEVRQKNLQIIIALDISNSMLAEDIKPSRLERTKQELSRLMDLMEDDQVGLVVFAGEAYTQIPITPDIGSAKIFLSGINPSMVSRQGTNIGSAIELATKSFSGQENTQKAIIVISDGENHEGNVLEACQQAVAKGIRLYTIGVGQVQGVRIPASTNAYNRDFQRDSEGNFVISKLNEQMLKDIASIGNGKYYRASSPGMGLKDIVTELENMQTSETPAQIYEEFEEQFPFFIFAALLIMVLDFMVLERKNSWFRKNIFNHASQ